MNTSNRTSDNFLKNGTKVSFMLRVWNSEKVRIETYGRVEGKIIDGDFNVCTFEPSYDIEYIDPRNGRRMLAVGVTEARLTIL